jgi:pilus assembly protein CpaC
MMKSRHRAKAFNVIVLCIGLLFGFELSAKTDDAECTVRIGQSEILDLDQPIKRVAISKPEIADATVISPRQLLLDGKSTGTTTLIIWPETGKYQKIRLRVCTGENPCQVMLHVRFMEVNRSALKEFGSDLLFKKLKIGSEQFEVGSYGGKLSTPSDPLSLSTLVDFSFAIPSQRFSAILKALQENDFLSILAAPTLSAVSGAEANFLAGGEFPIPIVSGTAGMQTITIQFKEFGIKLKFVPTVLDTALVNIKVIAEVSSLDFENGVVISGFRIPSLVSRKAETTVELKEGQYLVIGGLLSNELSQVVSKIPLLGQIPILGTIFSSRRYQKKETELLVTLSPQIVQAVSEESVPQLDLKERAD